MSSGTRFWRCTAVSGVLLVAVVILGLATSASAARPPEVFQLSYSESNDGSSPRHALEAFSRRTDSLGFSTVFHGRRAASSARFNSHITDTDIHGGRAAHPWVLPRNGDGRGVYRLIRHSLRERGSASVHVRARGSGPVDRVKVKIVESECTHDPPFYPLSCEIHL